MVANFLLRRHVRRVTIKQPQATWSTSTSSTHKTQDMTKHDLLAFLNPPRARSQSPKKRDRPTDLDNDNDSMDGDGAENDNELDVGPPKRIRHDSNSRLPSQTPDLSFTISRSRAVVPSGASDKYHARKSSNPKPLLRISRLDVTEKLLTLRIRTKICSKFVISTVVWRSG